MKKHDLAIWSVHTTVLHYTCMNINNESWQISPINLLIYLVKRYFIHILQYFHMIVNLFTLCKNDALVCTLRPDITNVLYILTYAKEL